MPDEFKDFDAMGSFEDLQHVEEELAQLRARLEALVVELDSPHKNGELVVMTADKVERHLVAQRIRAILRGVEK